MSTAVVVAPVPVVVKAVVAPPKVIEVLMVAGQ